MNKVQKYIFPIIFLILIGLSYLFDFASGEQIGLNFSIISLKNIQKFNPIFFLVAKSNK